MLKRTKEEKGSLIEENNPCFEIHPQKGNKKNDSLWHRMLPNRGRTRGYNSYMSNQTPMRHISPLAISHSGPLEQNKPSISTNRTAHGGFVPVLEKYAKISI